MLTIAPSAVAQDNVSDDVSTGLRGDGTDGQRNDVQRTINDVLQDLANGGTLDQIDLDVLNGLGGAQSLDTGELERLLGGQNRGLFKDILGNSELMEQIGQESPTGASFLEDVVAPIIGEFESGGSDGLLGAINFVLGSPTGGQYTLQGGYTYSDLLPSVFYSKKQNSDGVVNSLQLSLGELRKYPAGDADTYGQMASPGERSADTNEGSALTKYIAGLYDYDWVVTVDNDGNSYSPVGDTFNGDTSVAGIGLSAGVFGAQIYEMAIKVITWLADAFKTINLPTLLGLTDTGDADNWLTKTTRSVLDSMGLTKASVEAIQFLLMVVIGGAFLLVLMASMRQPERRSYNDSRTKALGFRVVMVVIAIPFISIFTGVVNNLTEPVAKDSYSDAAKINSAYVVDTLNWAAVTNLSLSDAGYGSPTSESSWESYKPTGESVGKLMKAVDARGISTGLVPQQDAERSATDLIEALRSGERTNVNAYLAALARGQSYTFNGGLQSARSEIAAASVPRRGETITSANHKNMDKDGAGRMIAPYFLSDRATDDKLQDTGDSGDSENTGDNADNADNADSGDAAPAEGAQDAGAHSKNTLFGSGGPGDKQYQCNTGAMSCAAVKWNTPSTYIYGADTPSYNSRSYRNFTGEIHDQNVQSNDPGNGEPSEDGILEANAVSIAMMNRYAGISNVNGVPSLSTQSVAFLLQSTYDAGTLRFNGYNTAAEGALGAKNNGAHGTEFLRYTMPNTGQADLLGKISALAIVWLTSGIIAVVALFALFRAPLLIALLNMFRGLFGAMTGKISGVLIYCAYYTALRCAFMFVGAAITFGAHVATWLVNMTGVNNALGEVGDSVRGDQNAIGPVGSAVDSMREFFSGTMTSLATIFVCLLLCAILCWPIFTVPAHKGQIRKLSMVSTIVVLPFLLADMAGEWIDSIARKVGEKPMRTSTAYAGKAQMVNQKDQLGSTARRVGHIARDAGAIGIAGATGGLTGIGGKLAKSALDKQKTDQVPAGRDGKGVVGSTAKALGGAVGAGSKVATMAGSGSRAGMAGGAGAGMAGAGAGTGLGGAGFGTADSAGSTLTGGVLPGYNQTLPNGGVRAGGVDNNGESWTVTPDGEVVPTQGAGTGRASASMTPANAAVPVSLANSGVNPEMLASMAAMTAAAAGLLNRGNVGGTDNATINRIDRADIGNAHIDGAVGGTGVPTDAPAPRQAGEARDTRDNSGSREPSMRGRGDTDRVPSDESRSGAGSSIRRAAGTARDVAATTGAVAYGAFDQGGALEKQMERMANKVTGTSAQDRRLPFEKERSSRLDPATLAREKNQSDTSGRGGADAGFKRALDQLRQQNEREMRQTRQLSENLRRTERELRRNSDSMKNWPRD